MASVENKTRSPKKRYKYCFVPCCTSTTIATPSKLFISVPRDIAARKKWLKAARGDDRGVPSTGPWFCCEDHFDMENDCQNYLRYKMVGGQLLMKKGVVPHKFDCQATRQLTRHRQKLERPTSVARVTRRELADLLKEHKPADCSPGKPVQSLMGCEEEENEVMSLDDSLGTCDDGQPGSGKQDTAMLLECKDEENQVTLLDDTIDTCNDGQLGNGKRDAATQTDLRYNKADASTQTNMDSNQQDVSTQTPKRPQGKRFRSKGTSANLCGCRESAVSPMDSTSSTPQSTLPLGTLFVEQLPDSDSESSEGCDLNEGSELDSLTETNESTDTDTSMEEILEEELCHEFRARSLERTRWLVNKQPKLYLGVPDHAWHIVELLSQKFSYSGTYLNSLDVVTLILRKIRLNEPFTVLCNEFGVSASQASRLFARYVPVLSAYLKQLIVWPDRAAIKRRLPAPFVLRYSNVQSIIDCFEIQIEKPGDAVAQSLSWSEYKKANTLKYLISITPNGVVNFISDGYFGRISDAEITEISGYLDCLIPEMQVMADRGFKHVDNLIRSRRCTLVRPASVGADEIPGATTTMESRRIACLRVHVERAIRRVREFHFIKPYSCIDVDLIGVTDYVVKIACALVNLQGPLLAS